MHHFVRTTLAAACLLPAAGAFAQSNVTLYGLMSTGVRYTHNIDGLHHNQSELVGSGIGGSRFGVRGSEDLGGGKRAIFTLEHGINVDTGTSANASTFWDRQAFVGLEGQWGTLSLGRQYNALNNVAWEFNPLDQTWGIFWSDPIYIGGDVFYQGYRINNSVVYQNTTGPVQWQLDYGFGEQAGSSRHGESLGAGALYRQGPWGLGLAYDQQRSNDGTNTERTYALGLSYAWQRTTLYAGHLGHRTSASRSHQRISYVGVGYQLSSSTHISGAYYHYRQNRQTTAAGSALPLGKGHANAFAAVLDYALSKRTSLYLEADVTHMRGGAVGRESEYWGGTPITSTDKSTRTGVMAGIRHAF